MCLVPSIKWAFCSAQQFVLLPWKGRTSFASKIWCPSVENRSLCHKDRRFCSGNWFFPPREVWLVSGFCSVRMNGWLESTIFCPGIIFFLFFAFLHRFLFLWQIRIFFINVDVVVGTQGKSSLVPNYWYLYNCCYCYTNNFVVAAKMSISCIGNYCPLRLKSFGFLLVLKGFRLFFFYHPRGKPVTWLIIRCPHELLLFRPWQSSSLAWKYFYIALNSVSSPGCNIEWNEWMNALIWVFIVCMYLPGLFAV